MSALTAQVRRLSARGATRSEIIHKLTAEGFAAAEVEAVVDGILERTAVQQHVAATAEARARRGVGSMALGAVLLVIGFTALFALSDPHLTRVRLPWGALVSGALLIVRGLRDFLGGGAR